jgi:hypothetical protein
MKARSPTVAVRRTSITSSARCARSECRDRSIAASCRRSVTGYRGANNTQDDLNILASQLTRLSDEATDDASTGVTLTGGAVARIGFITSIEDAGVIAARRSDHAPAIITIIIQAVNRTPVAAISQPAGAITVADGTSVTFSGIPAAGTYVITVTASDGAVSSSGVSLAALLTGAVLMLRRRRR